MAQRIVEVQRQVGWPQEVETMLGVVGARDSMLQRVVVVVVQAHGEKEGRPGECPLDSKPAAESECSTAEQVAAKLMVVDMGRQMVCWDELEDSSRAVPKRSPAGRSALVDMAEASRIGLSASPSRVEVAETLCHAEVGHFDLAMRFQEFVCPRLGLAQLPTVVVVGVVVVVVGETAWVLLDLDPRPLALARTV